LGELPELFKRRVFFIHGNSLDFINFESIKKIIHMNQGVKIMVILDSAHSKEHVLKEMRLYSNLVSIGSYMIVEDTHMNGHPVPWEHGEGPWEAVEKYLKTHDEFVVDTNCEKFGLSFNPNGYLLKQH